MSNNQKGVVAAGHQITVEAACSVLEEGGNAFDAALAALFASCVAEPIFTSLGGGGFLLGRKANEAPLLYDFFAQTPLKQRPSEAIDFYPILADFGTTQQEFHIGMGAIAVPGVVKGLFAVHRDLCTLPLETIITPAVEMALSGIRVSQMQHYASTIVAPIIASTFDAKKLHESVENPGRVALKGETIIHLEMAEAFQQLATEGEALFYQGEMGQTLIKACREQGGQLTQADLDAYRVERREPLALDYHRCKLFTNPAPSVGGTLIAFTLALLEQENLKAYGPLSVGHLMGVGEAMRQAQELRREHGIDQDLSAEVSQQILGKPFLESFRKIIREHTTFSRGTTQISVADRWGNLASMTLSNGEGCGYVLPGTGIMLNNMLGEEDVNPHGFHQWPTNRRIASMMAPTLMFTEDGRSIVTGSGGSNRIRSAILQTLINLVDFAMPVEQAVEQPRVHFESEVLHIEPGVPEKTTASLLEGFPKHHHWPEKNLFFGGAHSVCIGQDGSLSGHGDSRRGGVSSAC